VVAVKAVPLRRTGIGVLGQIPWGAHICMFYETKQDLVDAHVDYFKTGLQANEFCLWAISEPITEQEARDALAQGIPEFERHLRDERIELIPGREWYLKGGEFDLQRVTGGWHEKLRGALAKGFEGMRASGNAFWLASDHWKDFLEYEHELDRSLAGQAMIVMCTYPLAVSRATDVLEVAHAHNVTIARRRGVWEVLETFEATEAPAKPSTLTVREVEVLGWVARGKSAWEIGEILRISKRTVDEHVQRATRKLGAANRTQAAAIAVRDRIIDPSSAS
jgi:DNA-binding CsgD family transcriptional regulator